MKKHAALDLNEPTRTERKNLKRGMEHVAGDAQPSGDVRSAPPVKGEKGTLKGNR